MKNEDLVKDENDFGFSIGKGDVKDDDEEEIDYA